MNHFFEIFAIQRREHTTRHFPGGNK